MLQSAKPWRTALVTTVRSNNEYTGSPSARYLAHHVVAQTDRPYLKAAGAAVSCAIYVGIVADLEGLATSIALPRWQAEVPSLIHALRDLRNAGI